MSDPLNYQDFTLDSPWSGKFRFFIKHATFYRQAVDEAAKVTQKEPIREISKRAYDAAWAIAQRADGVEE